MDKGMEEHLATPSASQLAAAIERFITVLTRDSCGRVDALEQYRRENCGST
jgi:hypothetical protein